MTRTSAPVSQPRYAYAHLCRTLLGALAAIASIAVPAIVHAQNQPVTFSVSGDYPYGDLEFPDLEDDVDLINQYSPSKFFMHVGDMIGHDTCDEYRYTTVADILNYCQIPVFITPGDNEWGDCADPDQAWAYWTENFMAFDDNFCKTFSVDRQSGREENFAFQIDGVLFLGVNLPNQEGSGAGNRTQDAADWLVDQLASHGSQVRSLVIFGHAFDGGTRDTFFDQLEASAIAWGKPIIYIMGDKHSWTYDNPFPLAPNVSRITVNRGASEDPVQITATTDSLNPWDILRDPFDGANSVIVREGCGGGGVIISDVSLPESNSGTDPALFTVSISGGDGRQVKVDWATAPATADADIDYVSKSGTVTMSGTYPSKTFTVAVRGDGDWEPDETFVVNLSNPTNGGRIIDPQGICTILNDDPLPYYDITPVTFGVGTIQFDPPGTNHALNTVLTATAVFDSGWAFDHWTGALAGGVNPDSFVVTADTVLVANFVPNTSPVAIPESFFVNEDSTIVQAAPGLLGNDSDPDLNYPLTAAVKTPPANGTLLLAPDGSFTYTPDPHFFGVDTFVYHAVDARGAVDSATVTIDLAAVNDSPAGLSDTYSTNADELLAVGPPGVLVNDTDVDGDSFAAVMATPPWRGVLALSPDGSFTYDPFPGYTGVDTFTYRPTDYVGPGDEVQVTVSVGAEATQSFPVIDDGYVKSTALSGNFGLGTEMRVRGGGTPVYTSYVKFRLDGLASVSGARLRLTTTNGSSDGGDVYLTSNFYDGTSTEWVETGLNAGNAPQLPGSSLGNLGSVSTGQVVELDVSAAVVGDGTYTFAILNSVTNSAWYATHESATPPELIIDGFNVAANVTITPISHDYGDVLLGQPAVQPFEVRNDGTGDLVISSIAIAGPDAVDWVIESGGTPSTLAPDETQLVQVRFDAGSLGAKSAVLRVLSNSRNEAQVDATLIGRSVLPDIDSVPSYDFGDLLLGLTVQDTLEFRNVGTSDLHVDSVAIVGADSSEFTILSTDGLLVVPGDSMSVALSFHPTVLGPKNVVLRVASDDPDENPYDLPIGGRGVQPDIAVDPASQDFGDVVLGSPVARSFTVVNAGTAPLSVTSSTLVGADSTDFTVTAGAAPFALAAGESLTVEVTHDPSSLGPKATTLRLASDDPDEATVDLPLAGNGVQPDIRIEPASIDWGDVLVDTTSLNLFTIFNDGTSDLHVASSTVTGADSTEFVVTANGGALTVAAGDSIGVEISFTPISLGPKASTLRVESDDFDEGQIDLGLAGTGVQPDIFVDPDSHDYGPALLSEVLSRAFQVVNVGTADLAVTATSLAGADSSDFAIVAGAAPFSLAPGESTTVEVTFDPSALGPRATTFRFDSDDPDEDLFDVALVGLGVEPDIALYPPAWDWGGLRVIETVSRVFDVVNEGTADLHVTDTTLEGPDAAEFTILTGGAFTLAPGDSFAVEVSFHPSTLGEKTAALRLVNDDLDEGPTFDVTLDGIGIEPEIAVVPAVHEYGDLRLTETESQTYVVTNEGTHALSVTSTTLEGADAAEFTLVTGGAPFVLAPGESLTAEVSFHPSSLGAKAATLRLANDDLDENPLDVALTGTGVEPDIVIDPLAHDWGDVVVTTGAPRAVVVRNVGTHELSVETSVLIGTDPGEFSIEAGAAPFVLAAGDTAVIDLSFHPSTTGGKTAGLRITSDDPDEALLFISLDGRGVTPEIAVDPLTWDYGNVRTVEAANRSFVVVNEGTSALNVSATTLLGPDAADFGVVAGTAPFAVAPGESAQVGVDFQPSSLGPKAATLRLVTDDLDEATVDISLAGNGVEPNIVIVPTSWDFGGVRLIENGVHSFAVLNSGTADLLVTGTELVGAEAAEFTISAGPAPFVVPPGDSSLVEITFHPSRLGPKSAALRVSTDDASDGNLDVPFTGVGIEPDIAVEPASHDYGPVRLIDSAATTYWVRNDGTADLAVSATTLEGADAADFTITAGGGAFTLVPGDSAAIEVTFAPGALGAKSGTLRLVNDDLDEDPFDVPLVGLGVEPDIALDPSSLDWGSVLVSSAASGFVVVHNEGTFDLSVTSTTVEGPDAAEFTLVAGGAPFAVAPGDSATVEISFAPTSPIAKSATLRFASDDLDEATTDVPLAGLGVSPEIAVTPPSHDWGDLRLSEAVSHAFLVVNEGTSPLNVSGTTILGADAADFAVTAGGATFVVAAGESATVEVTFGPTALGPRGATLQVTSDDLDEGSVNLALTGRGVEPDVTVNPIAYDFGGIRPGTLADQVFVIGNAGTFPLSVGATTMEGPDGSEFSILTGAAPFVVAAGETTAVTVRFAPQTLGPKTAALRIASDDPDEAALDVDLLAQGIEPDVDVTPLTEDWGPVLVSQSSPRTFVVRNAGTDSLFVGSTALGGTDAAEFAITAGAAPFALAAGESLVVEVTFAPAAPGAKSAALTVASDDPDEPTVVVPLAALGVEPEITVTPASHDWGDVLLGTAPTRSFTVVNDGTAALNVTAATLAGPRATEFGVLAGAAPFQLAPGESIQVEVSFAPLTPGPTAATLSLVSDDLDEPALALPLAGTGVTPDITVSPTSHDYGGVLLPDSATQGFTVVNDGTSNLNVGAPTISGTDASEFSVVGGASPFALAPGESLTVDVLFDPTALGAKSATLSFPSDDLDESAVDVALTGAGVEPDVAVAPAAWDWGDVVLGGSVPQDFVVVNEGSSPLSVSETTLEGPGAAELSITGGAAPFSLAPGESASVSVAFDPVALGPKTATLRLLSDDPDEGTLDVPLAGRGVAPEVATSETSLDWGTIVVGQPSSRTLFVRNDGTSDLAVSGTTVTGPDAGEFSVVAGAAPFSLAPGESLGVEVSFAPVSTGPKTANLGLATDDQDETTVDVPLTGTGVEPDIALTPLAEEWGSVLVGETAARTFTVRNEGTSDLNVSTATFEGVDAAEFSVSAGDAPFIVLPGDSTAVEVTFAPASAGPKVATLRLASDDLDEATVDAALTGTGVTPDIEVTPSPHDFGATLLSATRVWVFDVVNEGSADLHLGAASLAGANASEFAITAGGAPATVAPGDSTTVEVSFTPTIIGALSATLVFPSDDLDENPLDVALYGAGVLADIAVTPLAHDWGTLLLGASESRFVTVTNDGSSDLNVTGSAFVGPAATDFEIVTGAAPFTLAPGESLVVEIRAVPTDVGVRTAELQLTSNDPDESPLAVELDVNVISPEIDVDPAAHDWGGVVVTASVPQVFQVRNTGSSALNVSATTLVGGDAAEFSIVAGGGAFQVQPGDSTAVEVSFAPTTAGAKVAILSITSDDVDEAVLDVALDGLGLTPEIAAVPTALDWGELRLSESGTLSVIVTNEGTSTLSVGGSSLEGAHAADFAILTGGGAFVLAPAESLTVEIGFQPGALGGRAAALRFSTDDLDEPTFDVPLSGTGVEPELAVDPASADFGPALAGDVITRTFTVVNEGTHDLTGAAPALVGAAATDFSFLAGESAFVLAPSESLVVELAFTPSALGIRNAALRLATDDLDESIVDLSLQGEGVEPDIGVWPLAHDWGDLRMERSSSRSVVVRNDGSSDLLVTPAVIGPDAGDWTIVAGGGTPTVAPGDSLTVEVSFSPLGLGARSATLQLASDDPDEPVVDVALSGQGLVATAPEITLVPASYDWGSVLQGTSVAAELAVRNDGDDVLNVTSVTLGGPDAGQFSIDSGGGTFALAPGGTRTLGVTFSPVGLGARDADITVASNDDDEPTVVLSLTGTGVDVPVGGDVVFASTLGSGATSSSIVTVPGVGGGGPDLFLAAVSVKPLRDVVEVNGLGLTWARVEAQCAGRSQTGVEVWAAYGTATAGPVTATLASAANNVVLEVTRYSGVDAANPIGNVVPGNTNGIAGLCTDGVDTAPYSFPIATGTDGAWIYSAASTRERTHEPGAGFTERVDFVQGTGGSAAGLAVQDRMMETAGATGFDGTFDKTVDWATIGLEIRGVPAAGPVIAADADAHDFGPAPAGSGSVSHSFTIRNDGTQDLHVTATLVTGTDAADFAITGGGAPFTLAPGATHPVEVSFAPASAGTRGATLRLTSNDAARNPFDLALTGIGVGPEIAVSPASVDYGSVPRLTSSSRTVVVHNEGTSDLQVTATTLEGADAAEFTIAGGGAPATIALGDSAVIVIDWSPTTLGAKSAGLRVDADDLDEPSTLVALGGTSVEPDIAATPSSRDWGAVRLGTSAPHSFLVTNVGTSLLTVATAALVGPDAPDFTVSAGGAPFAIAPGDSHTVEVSFAPSALGPRGATLRLSSDDPDEVDLDLTLTGEGVAPEIAATPASHDFGESVVGASAAQAFVLRNEGTADLSISATTVEGADSTAFAITAGGGALVVAPGDSTTVEVTFTPAAPGPKTAALRILNDDADENPLDVPLSGLALGPDVAVVPVSHDFGGLLVGDSTAVTLSILNEGTADLTVTATSLVGADAAEFSIVGGGGAATLAAGDSLAVEIAFLPVSLGAKTAALRVESDDPDEGTLDVSLTGDGIPDSAPEITVTPLAWDFGVAAPGDSAFATVEVRNDGDADLHVSATTLGGPHAPEFAVESGGGAFTLLPGESRDVVLGFRPAWNGLKFAMLSIVSDDLDEAVVDVALSGEVIAAPVDVALEESASGGASASPEVTSGPLTGAGDQLYLAAVTMKPAREVTGVTGLGLVWTRVDAQCAGRDQTGVEVWRAIGSAQDGVVTATFESAPSNGVIVVTRYSGVDSSDPVGDVLSVNTNGPDGLCDGGVDTAVYALGLTTGSNGAWAYGAASMRLRTHEPGFGFTERADFIQGSGGSAVGIAVEDRMVPTAGPMVVDGSFNKTTDWAAIALEIRPGAPASVPDIAVAPVSHDWGDVVAGDVGPEHTFTIRSVGTQPLDVVSTTVVGVDAADFSITSGGGAAVLAPGDSLTVGVTFAPTSASAKSASLRIASNDPNDDPLDVSLGGTGTPPPVADVAVHPASHDWGLVPLTTTADQTFAIVNEGTLALTVTGTSITGTDAAELSIVGGGGAATLAPGDSLTVDVRFAPTSLGAKSAALRVASDDPDEAVLDVPLAGTGAPAPTPEITVTPLSRDWGTVPTGAAIVHSFEVRNDGTADLNISGTTLGGPDAAAFAIDAGGGAATLVPGATRIVEVSFTPAVVGPYTAVLSIASDDADEGTVDVALAGEGIDAQVGGDIALEEMQTGGSSANPVVACAAVSPGAADDLWLAAIAMKGSRDVVDVTGLGLAWALVERQCSGRGTTGIEIWMAQGAGSGGVVTATLASAPNSAAIVVSRYSGADPLNPVGASVSGNTNGVDALCDTAVDTGTYSFPLVTTIGRSWVYGAASMRLRTHEPGAGFTERADFIQGSGGSAVGIAVEDALVAGAGAAVVAGSFDNSVDWAAAGLVINPAAVVDAPVIAVTPDTGDFGSTIADSGSVTRSFTVRNVGNQTLSVSGATIVGPDAAEFDIMAGGGAATINPGGSETIDVDFTPLTAGAKTATLRITSDDPDDPVVDVALTGTGTEVPTGGGEVVFEDTITGGSTSLATVQTSGPVTAVAGHLYLASVATKAHRVVTNVEGLGLTWTPVADQCGARGQTGVALWSAHGAPSGDGVVTATLESTCNNAVIVVTRHSGVDSTTPLGISLSGNTLGLGAACTGGVDDPAYAFDLATSVDGSVVFGTAAMRTKTHTPGAGFTERIELTQGTGGTTASIAVMDQTVASASTVSLAGTFSGSVDWAVIGVEIVPGAAPAVASSGPRGGRFETGRPAAGPISSAPGAFDVTRVYPNPFRSSITIDYTLPRVSEVSIAVYNTQGRLVRRIRFGQEPAGARAVTWDGRDGTGQQVGPGVYFVRLNTDSGSLTKKLVLRR